MFKIYRWAIGLGLMISVLVFMPQASGAATATVVGSGTPTSCTEAALRTAARAGGTITFNCGAAPHTIVVLDEIIISKNTTIDGGGPQQGGRITISGGGLTRVFYVKNNLSFTVRHLTISDGRGIDLPDPTAPGNQPGLNGSGAAIFGGYQGSVTVINSVLRNNDGTLCIETDVFHKCESNGGAIFVKALSTLTVQDSLFVGNRGINGGAINNLLSRLTVERSTFIGNDSTAGGPLIGDVGQGGAIYTDGASDIGNPDAGQIIIRDSMFQGNRAAGQGGAVFTFVYPPDQVLIERTTFDGNVVVPRLNGHAFGGGLRHGNGQLTVRDSTFSNNRASAQGGGIWLGEQSPSSISNVTLVGNSARSIDGLSGLGGAITFANGSSPVQLTNVTIANNHAGFQGGALWGGGTNVTLRNTIIANNTAANGGNPWNVKLQCGVVQNNGGNNLQYPAKNPNDSSDVNCAPGITIVDPRLGSLGAYGGATQTVALPGSSPAVNAGNSALCSATDQRGVKRNGACDIGAYELGTAPIVLSLTPQIVQAGGAGVTLHVYGVDFAPNSVVRWNGANRPATFISSFHLTATLSASDISTPKHGSVTVRNSVTGETSAAQTVRVAANVYSVAVPLVLR